MKYFFFYKKLFFFYSCEKYACLFYCIHFLIKYLKEIHIYTWGPYIHIEKCKNDFYHWIIFTIYFINFAIVKIKISWSKILHDINKIYKNKNKCIYGYGYLYIFKPPFTNIPDFNTKLFDVQNLVFWLTFKLLKFWRL